EVVFLRKQLPWRRVQQPHALIRVHSRPHQEKRGRDGRYQECVAHGLRLSEQGVVGYLTPRGRTCQMKPARTACPLLSFPSSAWERKSGKLCFPSRHGGRPLEQTGSGASHPCVPKQSLGTRRTRRTACPLCPISFLIFRAGVLTKPVLGRTIFQKARRG